MRWWWLAGGVLVAVGLGWWVIQVTLMASADRSNAASYGQFVLAAAGLLIMIGGPIRARFPAAPTPDLDELTDRLALAMHNQWTEAATDRRLLYPAPLPTRWRLPAEPVAGPITAATGHTLFDPLPGLVQITSSDLNSGSLRDLHRVYGGLASGRLLIVGGPGIGKSSAAILLMLDALRYRAQATPTDRRHIPVPVLFTLQGWDPATTSVETWLRAKMLEIPLFRGQHGDDHASALLRAGRVAVFLDGLDEIPRQHQPRALQALSEQAAFRLVLLTRTADLVAAAQHHGLTSAVALELQPLAPADVADYLLRLCTEPAPSAWRRLTSTLTTEPDAVVGRALTTPLAVSLVRDIYSPTAPVDELCDERRFPRPADVIDHLLDHTITAAYTPRPGQPPPRYTVETAHHTLTVIARHLTKRHTRDLAWWTVPHWLRRTHTIASAVLGIAVFGVGGVLTGGLASGTVIALVGGLAAWGVVGLGPGFRLSSTPLRFGVANWRRLLDPGGVLFGIWLGVVGGIGLAGGFVVGALLTARPLFSFSPVTPLSFGFLSGLMIGLWLNVTTDVSSTDSANPVDTWRRDMITKVVIGVIYGLPFGLVGILEVDLETGVTVGMLFALGLSAVWVTAIAHVCLMVRYRTPVRLIRFLEDARSRHLLRTVGPIYQFRHATLQDRLVASADPAA